MRRLKIFEWLLLLTIAIGAGPATSAMYQWSTTAGTNATADPSINWAEGMSPSSINDSARAMMAVLAGWRNDISGSLTTAGTSTAYTLTTNQGFASQAVMNGALLAFTVHAANGASPTLNVDGTGAVTIYTDSSGSATVAAGTMSTGAVYTATFYSTGPSWRLNNYYSNSYNIPLGGIMWSTVSTAPNASFIAPYGQCISTTTYATYWAAMGSPVPGACGAGTFAVIDLRGRYTAALDTLPGSTAASRMTATGCGVAFATVGAACTFLETYSLSVAQLAAHSHANSLNDPTHGHPGSTSAGSQLGPGGGASTYAGGGFGFSTALTIAAASTGVTISNASAGSSSAISRIPPTIGLIPWLRVL